MASEALCAPVVASRRGLLAFLWSIVTMLTALAFLVALIFALTAKNIDDNDYNNYDDNAQEEESQEDQDPEVAVTSRAMAFTALWTVVLAALLGLFGTVILGFQSPTGQYYTCCSSSVHKTTQLGLGSFIGALIMFANLTLVCSVLFGEFQIRDYQREGEDRDREDGSAEELAVERSSMAFSIMCMFLTVLYAGFAILTYAFSNSVMEENVADERQKPMDTSFNSHHRPSFHAHHGYIGERFDLRPSSNAGAYVGPTPSEHTTMA